MQNAHPDQVSHGKDVAYPLSEFHKFPWWALDGKTCGVGRGGITGGIDFNESVGNGPRYRPHISFVFKDITQETWEIPQPLADMLERHFQNGREDLKRDLRSLIKYEHE